MTKQLLTSTDWINTQILQLQYSPTEKAYKTVRHATDTDTNIFIYALMPLLFLFILKHFVVFTSERCYINKVFLLTYNSVK